MKPWLTNLVVALRLVGILLAGLGAAGVIDPTVPAAVNQALGGAALGATTR